MSAVADKLREARSLIEAGWTQGKFRKFDAGRQDYCYCADGALIWATDNDADGQYGALAGAVRRALNVDHAGLWAWNDAPERTQAEVLAAFDKAIELAEAQQ